MEYINIILGIIASVFSIIAAVVSLTLKSDIKEIRQYNSNNKISNKGNNVQQAVGDQIKQTNER